MGCPCLTGSEDDLAWEMDNMNAMAYLETRAEAAPPVMTSSSCAIPDALSVTVMPMMRKMEESMLIKFTRPNPLRIAATNLRRCKASTSSWITWVRVAVGNRSRVRRSILDGELQWCIVVSPLSIILAEVVIYLSLRG